MPSIHVEVVILVFDDDALVGNACCGTSIRVNTVVVIGRVEALWPVRLSGLLDARETHGRALAEREVGLKHSNKSPLKRIIIIIIIISYRY